LLIAFRIYFFMADPIDQQRIRGQRSKWQ
ncbi:MAG: hypothetical protein EZS28_046860, partial [Streblomastix strix]